MKTVLISLLISILVLPLSAQVLTSSDVTDIVKNVDSINNGELTTPIAPMCINALIDVSDKTKVNTTALYNKCAVDLCGLPGKSPSVFVSDDSYAKFLNTSTNKKINDNLPLIEAIVDKNLNAKKMELAQVKKFLSNPQQVYSQLSSSDKKEMNKNVFLKYVKIDSAKKVQVTPPSWADDNFKKALNIFGKNYQLAQKNKKDGGALCDASECITARGLYLKQSMLTSSLDRASTKLGTPQSRLQAINGCKAGLISAEIKEADEKKTKAVFDEAVKTIRKNYVGKFSAHSKGLLNEYLNSIVTKASPLDSSGQKENNVDAFKTKAAKHLGTLGKRLEPSELTEMAFEYINDPTQISASVSMEPCNDYGASIWDMFLSAKKLEIVLGNSKMLNGKDHIYISPFACQHADHGKQVVAHEIGHALNSFFQYNTVSESSAKNFNDMRACAKGQYQVFQKPIRPELSIAGDSLVTEEDHADLISYMAIGDKTIYTCSFLQPSATDKNSYTDLNFANTPGDSHSNSFARVIYEAINKKIALPQSCNDLIKEAKPKMRFNKCI